MLHTRTSGTNRAFGAETALAQLWGLNVPWHQDDGPPRPFLPPLSRRGSLQREVILEPGNRRSVEQKHNLHMLWPGVWGRVPLHSENRAVSGRDVPFVSIRLVTT